MTTLEEQQSYYERLLDEGNREMDKAWDGLNDMSQPFSQEVVESYANIETDKMLQARLKEVWDNKYDGWYIKGKPSLEYYDRTDETLLEAKKRLIDDRITSS